MPILTIEIVPRADEILPGDLARNLAFQAAEIFGSRPGGTWVKIITIAQYAENQSDESFFPIFVRVLHSRLPDEAEMAQQITDLTMKIAEETRRPPENIHIIYEPPGVNRVAFGGNLVR